MFRMTRGHMGNTLKTHRCHYHDVYHHASLGTVSAFCVYYPGSSLGRAAWHSSVWMTNGGELANYRCCSFSVWKGLVPPEDYQHQSPSLPPRHAHKPFSHRVAALSPQQQFANSLPLVIHTDRSSARVKMNPRFKVAQNCINKLKLQAAMNGPSQSRRVGACCCRGVPRTQPHCLIIVYASLNCPCFRHWRKGLNVISCVHLVALWLYDCILAYMFRAWLLSNMSRLVQLGMRKLFLY